MVPRERDSNRRAERTRRRIRRQPVGRVRWVKRSRLKANAYNPNHVAPAELELLKLSLLKDGWTQPIVARRDFEIVDGFHRWLVSEDARIAKMTDGYVPVVFLRADLSLEEQMAATVRHNRARGQHGVMPMSDLTRQVVKLGLDPITELGMEEEEVERLTDIAGVAERQRGKEFSKGWSVEEKRRGRPKKQ